MTVECRNLSDLADEILQMRTDAFELAGLVRVIAELHDNNAGSQQSREFLVNRIEELAEKQNEQIHLICERIPVSILFNPAPRPTSR